MYDDIEGIDYVFYLSNYDNELHLTDLTDKESKTENTGKAWYKDAYGNCLIALNAHITNKLYLIKKDSLKNLMINSSNDERLKYFEKNASKIITNVCLD